MIVKRKADVLRQGKDDPMKTRRSDARETAENLAIQALTYIAQDGERLGAFLAATGIGPARIRVAAREPGFLAGVLDYLASDEKLLTEFAIEAGIEPAHVAKARAALGSTWEREIP
jgi:hypothetical protein